MTHVNGWKVADDIYIDEVTRLQNLFIPIFFVRRMEGSHDPSKENSKPQSKLQTVMWDVLSGDFDTDLTPEGCLSYVLYHTKPGSIVVFHD